MGKYTDLIVAVVMTILIAIILWSISEINIADINPAIIAVGILFVFMVLMTGTEIEKLEPKPKFKMAELGDLEPKTYLFSTTPIQEKRCSLTGNCSTYYAFLERTEGGMIPVKIGVPDRIDITEAMGMPIGKIVEGEEFTINENHNVTKI